MIIAGVHKGQPSENGKYAISYNTSTISHNVIGNNSEINI